VTQQGKRKGREKNYSFQFSSFEILVLRAAVENHLVRSPQKHRDAAPRIMRELRKHDNPSAPVRIGRK
jgi:hypothetical protein